MTKELKLTDVRMRKYVHNEDKKVAELADAITKTAEKIRQATAVPADWVVKIDWRKLKNDYWCVSVLAKTTCAKPYVGYFLVLAQSQNFEKLEAFRKAYDLLVQDAVENTLKLTTITNTENTENTEGDL